MTAEGGLGDPRFRPATELIVAAGATGFQVRFDDSEAPVVWMAVAIYKLTGVDDEVLADYTVGAGLTPLSAMLRLCEAVFDGSICPLCDRPAAFSADTETMPAEALVCWFKFDSTQAAFRRSCEYTGASS